MDDNVQNEPSRQLDSYSKEELAGMLDEVLAHYVPERASARLFAYMQEERRPESKG